MTVTELIIWIGDINIEALGEWICSACGSVFLIFVVFMACVFLFSPRRKG